MKARALADKLDYARQSRITHGVRVDLDYQEMDLARDALRFAAEPQAAAMRDALKAARGYIEFDTDWPKADQVLAQIDAALAMTRPHRGSAE